VPSSVDGADHDGEAGVVVAEVRSPVPSYPYEVVPAGGDEQLLVDVVVPIQHNWP
jgi:hypothetical protein